MVAMLGELLGGVGLFLLGMGLMTDGLRLAAGRSLERLLRAATRTRLMALVVGLTTTAVVQSSSAVTAAIIGFVNVGLMNLAGALWVIFGANVGTTMTGWLVALVGLKIKIEAFALPLVGIGLLLRLTGAESRRGGWGTTLAGFGLLFLGIDFLRAAFADHAADFRFFPDGSGWLQSALGVGSGFVLTVLMQSSSAAMVVVLSAAQGGILALPIALAMVIGANIGTTATALFAAVGATSNAKRAAVGHVLFNALTGVVALALLPVAAPALQEAHQALGIETSAAALLASFHTVFNVSGVALMWPFADRLAAFLAGRFVSREEDLARPRYLDKTALAVPSLALEALRRELDRLGELARAVVALAIDGADRHRLEREITIVERLVDAVAAFVVNLHRRTMAEDVAQRLAALLRVARYHEAAAEAAAAGAAALADVDSPPSLAEWSHFLAAARAVLADDGEGGNPEAALTVMERDYQALKARLLALGASGELPVAKMDALLRAASAWRRALEQTVKARRWQRR